jgi:hypothetical protein
MAVNTANLATGNCGCSCSMVLLGQEQSQYPITGRNDIPTQYSTYTTYIIISSQLFATPQEEIREHIELSISYTRVIAHITYMKGTKNNADSQDKICRLLYDISPRTFTLLQNYSSVELIEIN